MNQEEEIYLKYEDLIEENDLDESQFSDRLKQKIQQIEELCDAYEECDEDEEEEIILKVQAMDDGICADLESVIAKVQADEEKENAQNSTNEGDKMADGGQSDGGQTNTNSDSPSWRFWM